MFDAGPEADARRRRAFAAHNADPESAPDFLAYGPDAPSDYTAKARYFGKLDSPPSVRQYLARTAPAFLVNCIRQRWGAACPL